MVDSQEWFDEVTSSRRPGSVGTIRSASAQYLLIPRPTRAEVLAQLPVARARDAKDREAGLRASAVRYDRESKRLLLELTNGFLFGVPVATLPHLKKATPAQLADVTLSPEGGAIRFDAIDADYSVPGVGAVAVGSCRSNKGTGARGGINAERSESRCCARERGQGWPTAAGREGRDAETVYCVVESRVAGIIGA